MVAEEAESQWPVRTDDVVARHDIRLAFKTPKFPDTSLESCTPYNIDLCIA